MDEKTYNELVEIRHYLHQYPELADQEYKTTAFLREQLEALNIEILASDLKTGLVAKIGSGRPVIALRADIDALPVQEETALPYASQNVGVMHACGHDLHMTALLGALRQLVENRSDLTGTLKIIFQPAEEIGQGADEVLATGLLSDVEAFIGFHNMPNLGTGRIALKEEGIMAAVERFSVTVTGQGSHAAYPQEGRDPIVATTAIIQGLQSIVSRNVGPLDGAVVSVTHVEAGSTWNVLPDVATFEGTIRTFDLKIRELVKERFVKIIEATAQAYGMQADIVWRMSSDLTYNDPELTKVLFEATKAWHEETALAQPSSAGEDFANYREQAPSVFAFIGSSEKGNSGLHHADLLIDDQVIPVAVDYFVKSSQVLSDYLQQKKP